MYNKKQLINEIKCTRNDGVKPRRNSVEKKRTCYVLCARVFIY